MRPGRRRPRGSTYGASEAEIRYFVVGPGLELSRQAVLYWKVYAIASSESKMLEQLTVPTYSACLPACLPLTSVQNFSLLDKDLSSPKAERDKRDLILSSGREILTALSLPYYQIFLRVF